MRRWIGTAPFIVLLALGCSESTSTDGSSPDAAVAADAGLTADSGSPPPASEFVPLFDERTMLQPVLVEDTPEALITRFADRGRDRHAREDQFQAYEHYLPLYWEHRTARLTIEDRVAKGGDAIRFFVTTEWKLLASQAELRFFYRGLNTVAEYYDNRVMTRIDDLNYQHEVSLNVPAGRSLQIGDEMEFELSQFLDAPPRGRTNYYGTTYLYVVGEGIVPWIGSGANRRSVRIPSSARLAAGLTIHENESNEPVFAFSQLATNLAPQHGQPFVRGRRLVHTDFEDGSHDESNLNPVWPQQQGKLGPGYISPSCNACHERNGRAVPPEPGGALDRYVVKLSDASGAADPDFGAVLQTSGMGAEATARLVRWDEQDGLRTPVFAFDGPVPEHRSVRISPALVGLGLLEAIPETDIVALADPDDRDGDGISGRVQIVEDPDGVNRVGRFGWKAGQPTVRAQTASALRTDMGVLTSVFETPDCGRRQTGCEPAGAELSGPRPRGSGPLCRTPRRSAAA